MSRGAGIEEMLPVLEIKNGFIVSKRGDVTMGFELQKPELFSVSEVELASMHEKAVKAIGILRNATVVHFADHYSKASFQVNFDREEPRSFLAESSDRFFHGRPYRTHRSFCFITRKSSSKRPVTSALSSLLRPTLVPETLLQPAEIEAFGNECRQFMQILTQGTWITSRELTTEDLAGTEEKAGLIEQYFRLGRPDATPELQDIDLDKGVTIGHTSTVLYSFADAERLPAQCSAGRRYDRYCTDRTNFFTGFAMPLGAGLDADHVFNLILVLDDPQPELKKLENKLRRLRSLSGNSRENAVTQDAINQYLEQAALPGQRPVKVHMNICASPDPGESVAAVKSKIVTAIAGMDVVPHLETVGAPQIWWACQPGNAADIPSNETFDTFVEQALCFFIVESNGRSSAGSFGIRLGDRATGIPLNVDLSDEPMRSGKITTRNKLVCSTSGGGKSFGMNHQIRCSHEQGAHVTVLDMGGSYKALCELLGGQYFECSKDQRIQFNPFLMAHGETMNTETKESRKVLLLTLWKMSDEKFGRSDYVGISNVLDGYEKYLSAQPEIFPCFDSFYEWLREEFAGRIGDDKIREKDFDCENFLYVLKPYYKGGEFDWLLNAKTGTDLLHQRMVVFDLDQIKDHPILFPVVTIVIMEMFISKMRNLKGVRKIIVIDEAWKAIAKEGMSEFIRYLFKTIRKFFGEAIIVTQELEDIIGNPVVKNTILNQADCKILLDMGKFVNRFDPIQEMLGLSEADKAKVLSLNKANEPGKKYKELFVALGTSHSRVYRLEVSLEEYLVYTTEETERVKVNEYSARHGGIRKGVAALAADIRSGVVKLLMAAVICCAFLLAPNGHASAQIIDLVEDAIKEALEQADLQIQRVQTATIELQTAEKALENDMAGGLLDDITGWVQDEEDLYGAYYQELWEVKTVLSNYSRVEQLFQRQVQLVKDYEQATAAVRGDTHFNAAELQHILAVYDGILTESIRNTGELALVIESFATQMDDAGRLRIIDETAGRIDRNYTDLREYTQENTVISLERAKDEADIQTIKSLYGIP